MKQKVNLPTNWERLQLKDIGEIVGGGTPSTKKDEYFGGDIPWIRPSDLSNYENKFIRIGERNITQQGLENSSAKLLPKGSLLFSSRAPIGYVAIAKNEVSTNQGFRSIIPSEKVNNQYLYYFLKASTKIIEAMAGGTTFKEISGSALGKLWVPLPPLKTQKQIVEKIEELFSDLDNGIENLKKAKQQLETYKQSVLKAAFEGKLTKDWREQQDDLPTPEELKDQIKVERKKYREQQLKEWEQEVEEWKEQGEPGRKPRKPRKAKSLPPLENEILRELPNLPSNWKWSQFYNVTFKIGDVNHKMPEEAEEGLPYLSTGDIKSDGTLDFSNPKIISEEDFYELSQKIKPERGDIIFPRYGTIGRNVLVNTDREFLISYSCAVIKNITNVMNEKFIYYYTLSPMIKKEIEKHIVETTQANIGLTSIGSFVIPICSKTEQDQIVQEIEAHLSVIDQVEETIKENTQKAEALRQSILKKAFSGKLVKDQ